VAPHLFSSMPLSELLGPTLQKGSEKIATDSAFDGKKAIGLYFSAHWCPPCRGFTPKLAEWYTKDLRAKGLEVVFVSSDRDEESFDGYFAEQPWLALPYAERDIKNKLSKKYKVSGIPSFIILSPEGELITSDGRGEVSSDPTGSKLPWKPPTFWEALGTDFLSGMDGDTVDVDDIRGEGKVIGLYFSAHWCPPCRGFTPSLVSAYNDHLKVKNLSLIFVSSDKDAKSFAEYYGTMPWLAIPNGDKRKELLSKRFDVEGIPSFVLVDGQSGETITTEGRGMVDSDPTGAEFPWYPKPVSNLSTGEGVGSINDELCLCVMMEGCDDNAAASAVAVLTPIAEASKAAGSSTCFFYAPSTGGPTPQIRKLASLGEPQAGVAQIVLLDIPDQGAFYVSDAPEVTASAIQSFLDSYKNGALERKQLG